MTSPRLQLSTKQDLAAMLEFLLLAAGNVGAEHAVIDILLDALRAAEGIATEET